MPLLMRAITPVGDIEADEDLAAAVGASDYDIYAQEVTRPGNKSANELLPRESY